MKADAEDFEIELKIMVGLIRDPWVHCLRGVVLNGKGMIVCLKDWIVTYVM